MDELIQFKAPSEMKATLEQWAEADDRSVAYIIRKLIEKEIARRSNSPDPALAEYEHIRGKKYTPEAV